MDQLRTSSDEEQGMSESSKGLLPNASAKAPTSHGDNSVWKRKSLDTGAEVYMTDDASSSSASPFRPGASDATGASEAGADDVISESRKHFSVFILFLINLLNYMDRFTVAGVLVQIQEFFSISNATAGLLQTVFVISYMVAAPLFGYLGDRYNRKLIMFFGIIFWSGSTLAASFIYDKNHFGLFMLFRALVGIGEASYSTIAPTIIGDMFSGTKRTLMLASFFFAIPVGSGLGYVAGGGAAEAFGSWHWALRVTPAIGVVIVIFMMLVLPDVKRGASDATRTDVLERLEDQSAETSYVDDLKYILSNKSFMFVTIGFTFMAFMAGSLSFWGPKFVAFSQIVTGNLLPCTAGDCEYADISFKFGVVLLASGAAGIAIGTTAAKKWNRGDADALICAIGLLVAGPAMLLAFELSTVNVQASWICIFLANLFMCFTWTPCTDMTLYITMPSRRSTANAVQILILHFFGDAGSPYLVGVISDWLQVGKPDTYVTKFYALKHAFYITPFACCVGGGFYLLTSLFVVKDRKKVDDALKGSSPAASSSSTSSSDVAVELATTSQRVDSRPHTTTLEDEEAGQQLISSPQYLDLEGGEGGVRTKVVGGDGGESQRSSTSGSDNSRQSLI